MRRYFQDLRRAFRRHLRWCASGEARLLAEHFFAVYFRQADVSSIIVFLIYFSSFWRLCFFSSIFSFLSSHIFIYCFQPRSFLITVSSSLRLLYFIYSRASISSRHSFQPWRQRPLRFSATPAVSRYGHLFSCIALAAALFIFSPFSPIFTNSQSLTD